MLTRTDFDNARTAQEVATVARRFSEDLLELIRTNTLTATHTPQEYDLFPFHLRHPSGITIGLSPHSGNQGFYTARAYLKDRSYDFGFTYYSADDTALLSKALLAIAGTAAYKHNLEDITFVAIPSYSDNTIEFKLSPRGTLTSSRSDFPDERDTIRLKTLCWEHAQEILAALKTAPFLPEDDGTEDPYDFAEVTTLDLDGEPITILAFDYHGHPDPKA